MPIHPAYLVLAVLGGASILGSCSREQDPPVAAAPAEASAAEAGAFRGLFALPRPKPAPVESTPELVALGRALYHDTRLSTGGDVSCASCHDLEQHAGADGIARAKGTGGVMGERNSPTTLNAFLHQTQFWDGRAATVEEQAQGPVVSVVEHGFERVEDFEARLVEAGYGDEFARLFGGGEEAGPTTTIANFGAAVGAFERTLRTESRFDRWVEGDDDALTDEEEQGLVAFVETGCAGCHGGRTLGGQMFQKLGVVEVWPTGDEGRKKVTGKEADLHVFKVPGLLNVADTAPYLHDGSVDDLDEMVGKMARHQLGKELTADEVARIVAFLRSTSGRLVGRAASKD